ncbi:MAG: 23S rRNA (pseudouridine(1915)-N(3))-methyltransferase RlmH [Acidobacteriota bacterium]|nr:23S rRNA (pseudouridine(1915)-N(3))-methyltransferase RlmH [Acidobacteriota bacterium]
MKLDLFYIGKQRDAHANALASEYMQRSERYMRCAMREIQPDRYQLWTKHSAASKILLDPAGKVFDSVKFSKLIGKAEEEAQDLVFVVGGADGLPAGWRERADILLSLSPMTFAHELARVMLAEQIYRALTMLRGHPYSR